MGSHDAWSLLRPVGGRQGQAANASQREISARQSMCTFSPCPPTAHIALAAMSAHQSKPACGPMPAMWLIGRAAGMQQVNRVHGSRSGCMACRSHSHSHSAAARRALHRCRLHDGNGRGDSEGGTVQEHRGGEQGGPQIYALQGRWTRRLRGGAAGGRRASPLSSTSGSPCPGLLSSTSSVVPANASKLLKAVQLLPYN